MQILKKMLKIVVVICISMARAHDDSPQGALAGFAYKLRDEVVSGERSRFEHSFSSHQQSSQIMNMAGGQLFTDSRARNTFEVDPVPGAKFWGNPGPNQKVTGQLDVNVYNPRQDNYVEQRFSVTLEHTGRNTAADWRVNAMQGNGLFGK